MNSSLSTSTQAGTATVPHLSPPVWVAEILRSGRERLISGANSLSVQVRDSEDFSLITVRLPDARQLPAEAFETRTAEIYRIVQHEFQAGPAPHPVRLWNHLPNIHAPSGNGTDRYMAFNAGRFRTYAQWFGGAGAFDQAVPSASAVGHGGSDLVIHALGARKPGIAIANPRQIAPYHYSKRFGPLPPCFARATVLPAEVDLPRRILVGGTASIRGEESLHLGDLSQQTHETFENLAHLVRAASSIPGVNGMTPAEGIRWLGHFSDLRIYYVREEDRSFLETRAAETFAPTCRIEFVRADLCRAELLVEIEGKAEE